MNTQIDDHFIESVKDALEHLYDFPALQKHSLTQEFLGKSGQGLRRQLLDAIESLNPGTAVYFRSPHARLYNLLHLHYVEGMTIQETSAELGISERQGYRDLRKGQESVAEILWTEFAKRETHISSIQSEVERLDANMEIVDIGVILQTALRSVERLANTHQKHLQTSLPDNKITISTLRPIAQQILISLLSHAIQNSNGDYLRVSLEQSHSGALIDINFRALEAQTPPSEVVQKLVDNLGWALTVQSEATQNQISIQMRTVQTRIMVIDDNEGLIELIDRYLNDENRQIISVTSPLDALSMLENLIPDAIILDVMMPEMDGWEVLQRLRLLPNAAHIPIIICSVFNDPELAYSLGATGFIAKPIDQQKVLNALQIVGIL